jgi:hypothetical protein
MFQILKNKFNRILYISLPRAHQILLERTNDYGQIRWDKIDITRQQYIHNQIVRSPIELYGYPTFDGTISRGAKLEVIPCEKIPDYVRNCGYKWSEDYNTIIDSNLNEPTYTGVCVRRKQVKYYLNMHSFISSGKRS